MILQVTFGEMDTLLRQKFGDKLRVSYQGPNTVTATYLAQVKVPLMNPVTKSFSGDIRILSASGSRVTVEIDPGKLGSIAMSGMKSYVAKKAPAGLLEQFDGRRATLNLAALPETRRLFDSLSVNNLMVTETVIYVDASIVEGPIVSWSS